MIGSDNHIPCPDCSEALSQIIDSRYGKSRYRRRRKCPNGHRATTVEMLAMRAQHIEDIRKAMDDVEAALEVLRQLVKDDPRYAQEGPRHKYPKAA